MISLKNLILSLSPQQRIIWGGLTILLPYMTSVILSVSALRSDALDDRRKERMLRSFADRLESDSICEKLSVQSPHENKHCMEMLRQQDQGLISEL
ncbi:MAG: hypothetical protein ACOH5I_08015 [Oligoflexus sp.]